MDIEETRPREDEAPEQDDLDEVGSHDLIYDDGHEGLVDDGTGQDIGTFDPGDTDADGIPDDLEVDDLDELVAGVDPDSDEVPEDEEER